MSGRTVVKVGGSLCGDPVRLRALLGALAEGAFGPCLVVPGGGVFADAVRAAQIQDGFDDAEAHRRALDAMGLDGGAVPWRSSRGSFPLPCPGSARGPPSPVEGAGTIRVPRVRKSEA